MMDKMGKFWNEKKMNYKFNRFTRLLFITLPAVCILSLNPLMAQTAIDVHCHNILPEYKLFLEQHNAAMDENFPLPSWDVASNLAFMEAADIQMVVLSMPAPQPYFGDPEECQQVVRQYNEYCAKLKSEYPDKFKFFAALPLPDTDAAIDEAIFALDSLNADGIKLATNSRGLYVGDEKLDSLMNVLNDRKAIVFLHPHKPSPINETIIKQTPLAISEYPAETTRSVINMIVRNIPVRYPDIKFIIPHCGSYLPTAVSRMKAILPALMANGYMQAVDLDACLGNFYYDLAGGATPEVVRFLLSITSPSHLLYGSDYPYQRADVLIKNKNNLSSWLKADAELAPYAEDILFNNAFSLLNK